MNTDHNIKIITYAGKDYQKVVKLRYKVLRKPLGLSFSEIDLQQDKDEIIIGIFNQKRIIAVLQLKPLEQNTVKLRQMAVDNDYRRGGYGKKLIRFAEDYARKKGFRQIILHARQVALGFYEKLGYQNTDSAFTEVGIPHFKMYKDL